MSSRGFAILLISLLFWSCSRDHHIVVGSKNFTESLLLGEIAAQQLERKLHVRVERRLDLGGKITEALARGSSQHVIGRAPAL